jgi:hypothetical protein
MDYRCPKHDLIFESSTDNRKPGSAKSDDGKLAAMPLDGHPDCPKCKEDIKAGLSNLSALQLQAGVAATKKPATAPVGVVKTGQTTTRKIG